MLCSSMVAKSIGGGSKLQMSNLWIRCWFIYYRQLLRLSHRWPGPKFFLCSKIKKSAVSLQVVMFHATLIKLKPTGQEYCQVKRK